MVGATGFEPVTPGMWAGATAELHALPYLTS